MNVLVLHLRPASWNGQKSVPFKLPIWMASDLYKLILQPENEAKFIQNGEECLKRSQIPL